MASKENMGIEENTFTTIKGKSNLKTIITMVTSLLLFSTCDTMVSKPPLEKGRYQHMFQASDFKRNAFFFLDTLYRNLYNKNYNLNRFSNAYKAPPKVTTLDVYIIKEIFPTDKIQDSLLYAMASDGQMHYFYKLIPDKHYELFSNEGFVRFDTALNSIDEVAIYLRTEDQSINKGTYGDTAILWTLQPRMSIMKAEDDPARFYLMWRNVYDLDTNHITTFQLSIWRGKEGEDSSRYTKANNGQKKLISALLSLTTDDGIPLTEHNMIFDQNHEYIIIPPYDTCSTCNEPFNNPLLGAGYQDSIIYRYSCESSEWREHRSIYYFITSNCN